MAASAAALTGLATSANLTAREREIMAFVTTGYLNKQVAGELSPWQTLYGWPICWVCRGRKVEPANLVRGERCSIYAVGKRALQTGFLGL